jgi:hypothetical protein
MSVVVALYSKTDTMVRPWLEAGHSAVIVDLQHPAGETQDGRLTRIGANMLDWVPPHWLARADVRLTAAFPPCTDVAVSGARWFAGKGLGKLAESIRLFERAAFWCEWFGAPYLIENPVSTISSYWRKPDHTFHPWHFAGYEPADAYTKKTCLWTGNGFVMPTPFYPAGTRPDDRIHKAPPSEQRADFRSATPLGFSRAVSITNHCYLLSEKKPSWMEALAAA